MKKILLLSIGLSFTCGCVPLLIGTGVIAGYSVSNDAAYGNVKEEYRVLWDLCVDKLESMDAEIISLNESKGCIKAKISDNSVLIRIDTLNSQMQRLKISARKYLLPKPQFAQKIFLKIAESFE